MKIKNGFLLKEIAGNYVVVPVGNEAIRMKALINLNATGAFLWKNLQVDVSMEQLVQTLMNEYLIDHVLATKDINNFIDVLVKHQILE
jgi:hypothetical protein